jgi:hypothetical protein
MVGTQRAARRSARPRTQGWARAAAIAVAVTGVGIAAAPAEAADVGLDCVAEVGPPLNLTVEVDGDPEAPGRQPQIASFTVTAPATAPAGGQATITIPGGTTTLPDESTGFQVDRFENIRTSYKVIGATVVPGSVTSAGSPTANGAPVAPLAPVTTADTVTIGVAGPVVPAYVPGPGGGASLTSPTVTFKVTAGAVGSTIQIVPNGTVLTAFPIIGAPTAATTTCTPPPNGLVPSGPVVLASITVVAPPPPAPPGAPTAANDLVSTRKDTPVAIDVLANDTPDPEVGIDLTSLAVKTAPAHGTAAVADGTIVYAPAAGYVGGDTFQYEICSLPTEEPATTTTIATTTTTAAPETTTTEPPALTAAQVAGDDGPSDVEADDSGPKCHFANVTVTVDDVPVTPETTPTTAAPPGTTATPELPRTGDASDDLGLAGFALVVSGLAAVLAFRPRRRGSVAD